MIANMVSSDRSRLPKSSGATDRNSCTPSTAPLYSATISMTMIDPMPGTADSSAATTRRRLGTTDTSLARRSTRSTRTTEK